MINLTLYFKFLVTVLYLVSPSTGRVIYILNGHHNVIIYVRKTITSKKKIEIFHRFGHTEFQDEVIFDDRKLYITKMGCINFMKLHHFKSF
jgi:hypothetical protein